MATDIMLYWGSDSPPCWRVMIALEEKQLHGYNNKLLSFDKQEHKCAEVMKLNPRGQVTRTLPLIILIHVISIKDMKSVLDFMFAASNYEARRHHRERVFCRVHVSGGTTRVNAPDTASYTRKSTKIHKDS